MLSCCAAWQVSVVKVHPGTAADGTRVILVSVWCLQPAEPGVQSAPVNLAFKKHDSGMSRVHSVFSALPVCKECHYTLPHCIVWRCKLE